jgi:hypothetical protein
LLHRQKQKLLKRLFYKKTWKFSAKNVRDFGIATSRKFILDAMAVQLATKTTAVSIYPKEANPLWEKRQQ